MRKRDRLAIIFMVVFYVVAWFSLISYAECTSCGQVEDCVWDVKSGGWIYLSVNCGGCGQPACQPDIIEIADIRDYSDYA